MSRLVEENTADCAEDLIPTRGSLLSRLKDWEDGESWRTFFDTYWRLIYHFALRNGLAHQEAQEVVQETVVAVAKNIGKFRYDPKVCRFKTWLLGVTRSKIANQFARRARQPLAADARGPDDSRTTPLLDRLPDEQPDPLARTWDQEWQKNLMDAAIRRVKRRVSIEQYQMFDLFVLKEWPASEVARTLGVTIGHVYVAKHRVSKLVRKEVEAIEAEEGRPG
ncbi:MAG: sigma-70 family RNA polymerase sigma factor [Verrucomicrobiae bacterium]|nr:sigma-70 family RNA polymerase sigma factor [Verrucomicrobiae bacterium]MCP5524747.1 sigma-70 family RNA polymerase sigma factor [Verrucomicrobiales bacterium]